MSFWENFKSKLGIVVAILIGILTLGFFLEKDQKEAVEEKLLNKDADDKDKELKQQQDALQSDIKKTEETAKEQKEQPLTEDETVDILNNLK